MAAGTSRGWAIKAIGLTILVNALLIGTAALLISDRGVPEPSEDRGAIRLVSLTPPEPPPPEAIKEPEPPKPKQKMDFTPDLVPPPLLQTAGPDIGGVSIDLGDMGAGIDDQEYVFEAFELDQPPRPVTKVPPNYPFKAREQNIEGIVQIKLLVNADGSVGQVIILDARPKGIFETAVMQSVPRWRFAPGKIQGRAVTAWVVTAVRFELN